jgi:AhpD family alkylhydroperoxidase
MRLEVDPAVVRANFARVADNPSLCESAQLFAAGKPVVEMIQAFAMNPGVLRAFSGLADVYPCGTLERPVLEKVILRVSQLHECQFCVSSHVAMMTQLGISTDLASAADHSPREQLAMDYAALVTRDANRVPDEFFARLRAAFNDPEIVELTFMIGLITMLNRFNNALQIRHGDEYAGVRVQTFQRP